MIQKWMDSRRLVAIRESEQFCSNLPLVQLECKEKRGGIGLNFVVRDGWEGGLFQRPSLKANKGGAKGGGGWDIRKKVKSQ